MKQKGRWSKNTNSPQKWYNIIMINAWSLAAEVLEGTLDETYPIKKDQGGKPPVTDEGCTDDSDSKHG